MKTKITATNTEVLTSPNNLLDVLTISEIVSITSAINYKATLLTKALLTGTSWNLEGDRAELERLNAASSKITAYLKTQKCS